MFNRFKKQSTGDQACFKIEGMHCASCAMNIDGELEELEGVLEANTNYAKAETKVKYDSSKVSEEELRNTIEKLSYKASKG